VTLTAGLEIGKRELVVCVGERTSRFANDREGHQKLLRYLTQGGAAVRVCLEATGCYHFDVALALHAHPRVQVQVLNPFAARRFAEARLQRAKTDRVDAAGLREYAERMPHQEWEPPTPALLALRSITRRMRQLADLKSSEGNRLHAATVAEALPSIVADSVREDLAYLDGQLKRLQREARALVKQDPTLARLLQLLVSVPGIGERSGLYLLGELAPLARDLSARQLVAHAGLDPRPVESGSSVHKPRHISKRGSSRLRQILYMTALVAARTDPAFAAFYAKLQQQQKAKKLALVAIMRKQLHAIRGIWASDTPFDAKKLFTKLELPQSEVAAPDLQEAPLAIPA